MLKMAFLDDVFLSVQSQPFELPMYIFLESQLIRHLLKKNDYALPSGHVFNNNDNTFMRTCTSISVEYVVYCVSTQQW